MSTFYVHVNTQERMVYLCGAIFSDLAAAFPIVPTNVIFLQNYDQQTSFDNRLCVFYGENEQVCHLFEHPQTPSSFGFIDYKSGSRPYLSEKECDRYITAAEQFGVLGAPFSQTLDNQYFLLAKADQMKLYLKNIDRFVPLLTHLITNRICTKNTPPIGSAIMQSLYNLCTEGAIFWFDAANESCTIQKIGKFSSKEQLQQLKITPTGSPGLLLAQGKGNVWKLTQQKKP